MSPILGAAGGLSARAYGFTSGAAAVGDYESIQTYTVGAGGTGTITFSSIPTGYKHLQIRSMFRSGLAIAEDTVIMRFNGDSGNNYSYHFLFGNGSTANATSSSGTSFIYPWATPGSTFLSNSFGVQVTDLLDYSSTTKNKTTKTLSAYDDNASGGRIALASGAWYNTSAVTSISITTVGNSITQYSSFALYGIR